MDSEIDLAKARATEVVGNVVMASMEPWKHFGDGEYSMMGPTSLNYALSIFIMTS